MRRIIYSITLLITINSCQIFDESKNVLISEHYNENQSLKVVVFERLGNATTNNSIRLSIEDKNYQLKDSDTGNIVIADKIEATNQSEKSKIIIAWKNNQQIEIQYPSSLRIFKKEERFKKEVSSIQIKYNLQEIN